MRDFMKKLPLLLCLLVETTAVLAQNNVPNHTRVQQGSASPTGLTVEYIREPAQVGIKDFQPEFGWLVPTSAVLQTGFQVLVASSKALIDKNEGDVWNSGPVYKNGSTNVTYQGTALQTGKTYHWKVRIWDAVGGRVSIQKRRCLPWKKAMEN